MIKSLLKLSKLHPHTTHKAYFSNKPNKTHNEHSDLKNLSSAGGIYVNEERIKAKMKEIKERGTVSPVNLNPEFLKNYQINKETPETVKFRRDTDTEDLMNFEDVALDEKPTILQVTNYDSDEIEIDSFGMPPSIVLTPKQVFTWDIPSMKEVTPEHLKIIEILNPAPEYVILGCTKVTDVSEKVRQYLKSLGINHDVVEMFGAVSNFNIYSSDEIEVVAFLDSRIEGS